MAPVYDLQVYVFVKYLFQIFENFSNFGSFSIYAVYSHLGNTEEMQNILRNPLSISIRWLTINKNAFPFPFLPFYLHIHFYSNRLNDFYCSVFIFVTYFASFL